MDTTKGAPMDTTLASLAWMARTADVTVGPTDPLNHQFGYTATRESEAGKVRAHGNTVCEAIENLRCVVIAMNWKAESDRQRRPSEYTTRGPSADEEAIGSGRYQ